MAAGIDFTTKNLKDLKWDGHHREHREHRDRHREAELFLHAL
jgi:hypothetical protein